MASQQEVLDQVYDYFITQHHPAGRDEAKGGRCTFTGPCALGLFMTPEARQQAEAHGLTGLYGLADHGLIPPQLQGLSDEFLRDIQFAHDNSAAAPAESQAAWEMKLGGALTSVAQHHGLQVPA